MSNTTLTAIDGLLAGHATDDRNHTGCTAILCPQGFTPGIPPHGKPNCSRLRPPVNASMLCC